jgi:RecA-family ATPase
VHRHAEHGGRTMGGIERVTGVACCDPRSTRRELPGMEIQFLDGPSPIERQLSQILDGLRVAAPSEKLDAATLAAQLAGGLIGPDLPRREVVDQWWEEARKWGLEEDYDVDILQARLTEGLDNPISPAELDQFTLLRAPAPNGNAGKEVSFSRPIEPAALVTAADWPVEAPPPVEWLSAGRIPRGDVTALHGDGGAGKTDIATLLAANCARLAQDWLGHEIVGGPVVFVSAEELERELRRRVWLHAQRDGYGASTLSGLHLWFPDKTGDTVLAVPDRSGIMQPTPLLRSITAAIERVRPVLVTVDNVAATFAGNQNDRVMVRSYVNLWRQIAHGPSRPAVLLLDHPSLSGLTNNTGRGGNMDWRNAVRSALWLHPSTDTNEAERGIRILETTKSNYGPTGNPLRLQWADCGLQLEHAPNSLRQLANDAKCEEMFLRLVEDRVTQRRDVSDKPSRTYAPKIFSELDNNGGYSSREFSRAMEQLFRAGKITLEQVGPPSDRRNRIVRSRSSSVAEAAE